jgi:2-succinyl-5-enolpyruvyl-6-hydroxy-3-cyclohexene-1-carboxylate synthase
VNPSTALATVLTDELIRCGLREAVLAPGSRSAPLALALFDRASSGELRLHVRADERSAAFLALGLAKASRRPAAVACTSGTAAAHFHAAVIEADESAVPLLVLTADRPPELRGTGANQTIDQVKLYGSAVRLFGEVGTPEARPGMNGYWRSLACRAWARACGSDGGLPGPVHLNLAFREPLVPDAGVGGGSLAAQADAVAAAASLGVAGGSLAAQADAGAAAASPGVAGGSLAGGSRAAGAGAGGGRPPGAGTGPGWPESLAGRPGGAPWTVSRCGRAAGVLALDWTQRGVIVCGDGDYDAAALVELAEAAGWPLLAEPSSGARQGTCALSAYPYLLDSPAFLAAHRPDLIVSAGRPGLSRGQLALLRGEGPAPDSGQPGHQARHIVLAGGAGRWSDPARTGSEVADGVRLAAAAEPSGSRASGGARATGWLAAWLAADRAARSAADAVLDATPELTEPRLARDLAALLPDGALLWAASSLPIRDLDRHMPPRTGLRVLANRGASGIDGLVSAAIGAALAHQAAGSGPAVALLGDLALLHDLAGLAIGPAEPRPDLCLIVVHNDGGGIFSDLEQAAFAVPFERVFGTPHGTDLRHLAAAFGLPYLRLEQAAGLPAAMAGTGLRLAELRTDRGQAAELRAALRTAATAAV